MNEFKGFARVAEGDRPGALQAYEQSRAIRDKLAARDPDNAEWQRDLSISFDRIGDVQRARGNLDAALEAYRDSLAIREKLAAHDPGNTGWQRDLIVSNVKLAEVAEEAGKTAEARGHYQGARDITVALRDAGRLAPVDAWMVEDLEARLERVDARAGKMGEGRPASRERSCSGCPPPTRGPADVKR
jgi:tetratricopeptide (TPR) repeat protein